MALALNPNRSIRTMTEAEAREKIHFLFEEYDQRMKDYCLSAKDKGISIGLDCAYEKALYIELKKELENIVNSIEK